MRESLERGATLVMVTAAIVMAAVGIRREFFPPPDPNARPSSGFETEWRGTLGAARAVGDSSAPITLVEFTDMQCPFCARFQKTIKKLLEKYPSQLRLAIVHFPLEMHDHAFAAAVAVECAARQGRLTESVDVLYQHQDSLGKAPWRWFARESGVGNIPDFDACLTDTTSARVVDAGLSTAQKLGLRATPTLMLNGWRYSYVPHDTELVRAIEDILGGRRPYSKFPASEVLVSK
jgi:protein-disulfide isomerase